MLERDRDLRLLLDACPVVARLSTGSYEASFTGGEKDF